MSNYSIKIGLLKAGGSLVNLKGNTGVTKQCIVLPVDDCGLFIGEKDVYLNITAVELKEPKHEQTHFLKRDLPKEEYEKLTDEQKKEIPIMGNMKPVVYQSTPITPLETMVAATENDENGLPF